jgi:hypothetical protein
MPESKQQPTHLGTPKDHDPARSSDRIRGVPADPSEGEVDPGPPKRGWEEEHGAGRKSPIRGNPPDPSQGDVNPPHPAWEPLPGSGGEGARKRGTDY